jgi:omega-6 fatty acid desaturase (delta-12 desaturase)
MSQVLVAPLPKLQTGLEQTPTRAEVHARIAPFARANSFQGYKSFAIDIALYVLGIAGVLYFDGLLGKILAGLVAGQALVNLGSLSHEAAHRSVVRSRLGNKVIAVVSFTAILFNYRLWVYEHHVLHHGRTNTKGNNFLSPLTLAEYRALPRFRRALYRAYHSQTGLGILLYYLLERWPGVHFYPGSWLPQKFRASAWGYTALLTAYIAALLSVLVLVPSAQGHSIAATVICGFVLPYTIWFTTFAMTAFLQHTNPQLRWYRDVGSMASPAESTAVHVGIPHWMNHITHYVLEHSVHHVSAMIPHYHLKRAQAALAGLVEPHIITMPFTIGNMRDVLRRCRLYDYDAHVWRDFTGAVTAVPLDISRKPARPAARVDDGLLPDQADPTSPGVFFPAESAAGAPPAVPATRERA